MSTPAGRHAPDGTPDLNAIAGWIDGGLGGTERVELAAHLAECRHCRAIVAELSRGAAQPAHAWRPLLAMAATITVAAIGGGAYFIAHQREPLLVTAPPAIRPAVPTPPAPVPSTAPAPSTAPPPPSSDNHTRAAGKIRIHGKTFQLVAGEWVDEAYRESDFLPVVQVSSRQQLDAIPSLGPYAALGSRFTVVIHGTVYKISNP